MNWLYNLFILLFAVYLSAEANQVQFDELLNQTMNHSRAIEAQSNYTNASEINLSRTKLHWAPRLFLNAGAISTNDASTTLFSILGSRTIESADFAPDKMNHPNRQWYKNAKLILDLPIYEGGMKQNFVDGSKLQNESEKLSLLAVRSKIYSELVEQYAKLISLNNANIEIESLRNKTEAFISKYKVASKQNPLGYSGYLGMKSLLNKLDSMLAQNKAEMNYIYSIINANRGISQLFTIVGSLKPKAFVDLKFNTTNSNQNSSNLEVRALQKAAEAQSEYAKAEKARYLPKIGLFGSKNYAYAPRDNAQSTEYGAYLQWEIFGAPNIGAYKEAKLKAAAFQAKADQMHENSLATNESINKNIPLISENLIRIYESNELTNEQLQISEKLFQSGTINALQFSEVLSRRSDVIDSKSKVEIYYIEIKKQNYLQNVSES